MKYAECEQIAVEFTVEEVTEALARFAKDSGVPIPNNAIGQVRYLETGASLLVTVDKHKPGEG